MAAGILVVEKEKEEAPTKLSSSSIGGGGTLSSYLGLSFAIFLGFLPRNSISIVSNLQYRNRELSMKLIQAEEELRMMKSRRKEDSKANARVVEIFASHRNAWQQEEKRLLHQIEASSEEIAHLRARIDHLEKSEANLRREVDEREEMINFMSRRPVPNNDDDEDEDDYHEEEEEEDYVVRSVVEVNEESHVAGGFYAASQIRASSYGSSRCEEDQEEEEEEEDNGEFDSTNFFNFSRSFDEMRVSEGLLHPVPEECFVDGDRSEIAAATFLFARQNGLTTGDFSPSAASKIWADNFQDVRCDSLESSYQAKHFVARRESPWRVDGGSTGVSSKLKLLEQELMNLEKFDKGELSKIPSMLRKQAKRYQTLAGKIDDLCKKMRANDPSEPTISSEFRTRHQTEFLIEAYRLQQRAVETGQKLTALQTETTKSNFCNGIGSQAQLTTRRCLDSIRNNFREIQRNLEVWLARIMGDLEGILATDGASRVREYYMSRYPLVQ